MLRFAETITLQLHNNAKFQLELQAVRIARLILDMSALATPHRPANLFVETEEEFLLKDVMMVLSTVRVVRLIVQLQHPAIPAQGVMQTILIFVLQLLDFVETVTKSLEKIVMIITQLTVMVVHRLVCLKQVLLVLDQCLLLA